MVKGFLLPSDKGTHLGFECVDIILYGKESSIYWFLHDFLDTVDGGRFVISEQ